MVNFPSKDENGESSRDPVAIVETHEKGRFFENASCGKRKRQTPLS